MDCSLTPDTLALHHLGALDDDERARVDAHLIACTSCLKAYLALKAHAERRDKPSDAARKRLRDEVERTFRPGPLTRARRFFGRPIPLYQGLAAAAVIAVIASTAPTIARSLTSTQPTKSERIDTARGTAESLGLY